jgi:phenylalanyl-tRNA synthetase beta chain
MKISYNQLKHYIDLDINPQELAEVLTDIGLEVEGLEEIKGVGGGMDGLKIGLVISAEKHPDADKLKVTKVDIAAGEELQIVCGAPNVAAGQKVIVATVGSTLHPVKGEPFQIKKAKIRGVESHGMICAEDEIGIGESHDGIIVLPDDAAIGTDAKAHYNIQPDSIFDIALTANRADATGHIGVARDIAAALSIRKQKNYELKYPALTPIASLGKNPIKVMVENAELCPRYSGIVLQNITVQPSPDWLQTFLINVGLRPINNVVDITNFVLLEYGQPLHAFDAAKIKGDTVVVKTLNEGTPFVTLDGVERKLSASDLMICNAEEPMCIAGVFGGLHSGVTDNTKSIFLESACFNPVAVRKTAHRYNLRTDAAQRFEKGTDINVTVAALQRAVSLLLQYAGGEIASDIADVYPVKQDNYAVSLSYKKLDTLTGTAIERTVVQQILKKLEIGITEENESGLQLSVPLFKTDVQRDVDVIEEILRIYGYNQIPFPDNFKTSLAYQPEINREQWKEKVSEMLVGKGYFEILTNSISNNKYAAPAYGMDYANAVRLLKSANSDLDTMRPNMLVTGLESVAYNHNRRNFDLKFFEFGKTYKTPHPHPLSKGEGRTEPQTDKNKANPKVLSFGEDLGEVLETEHLALFTSGNITSEHWRNKDQKADFFFLKGIVENVLALFGIRKYETEEIPASGLEYGLQISAGKTPLVSFGSVSKKTLKQFDIEEKVFYADFLWQNLLQQLSGNKPKFSEIPKFPWVRRDLALLLDRQVPFADVEKIAFREVKKVLKSVNLFDIYEDKRLGDNKKSYAVSFIFEDEQKTLKDEEVDKWMQQLMEKYKTELKAEIR